MTVGSVTARSHGTLPANIAGRPSSGTFHNLEAARRSGGTYTPRKAAVKAYTRKRFAKPRTVKSAQRLPRIVRTRIPASVSGRAATTVAQKVAILKMAKLLTRAVSRSTPLTILAAETLWYVKNQVVEPPGFPGFGAIDAGWRFPVVEQEVGTYAPNLFDVGPWQDDPSPRSLLDSNDIGPGFSIRYWGDFGSNPYPDPVLGLNWPVVPQTVPFPVGAPAAAPALAPEPLPRVQYRKLRDQSNRTRPRLRWRPTRNMEISFPTRSPRATQDPVRLSLNVKRIRGNDNKASPANQFVYAALLSLANAMGETKEWIDILAEAAGYDPRLVPIFAGGGHETLRKAGYIFIGGGINNIDFDLLRELVRENIVEDAVFGFFGNLAKVGSRRLGLTVGVQAGPGVG